VAQVGQEDVDGDLVISTFWNDEVGPLFAGFDKLQVHGTDRLIILFPNLVEGTTSAFHVSTDASKDANVGSGVYKDLQVQAFPDALVNEDQDAFDDDHGSGVDLPAPWLSKVGDKIVVGNLDRFAAPKFIEVLDKEVVVQRVGVVIIDKLSLLKRHFGEVAIITVVVDEGSHMGEETLANVVGHSAFAGTSSSGDTNNKGFRGVHRVPITGIGEAVFEKSQWEPGGLAGG